MKYNISPDSYFTFEENYIWTKPHSCAIHYRLKNQYNGKTALHNEIMHNGVIEQTVPPMHISYSWTEFNVMGHLQKKKNYVGCMS